MFDIEIEIVLIKVQSLFFNKTLDILFLKVYSYYSFKDNKHKERTKRMQVIFNRNGTPTIHNVLLNTIDVEHGYVEITFDDNREDNLV